MGESFEGLRSLVHFRGFNRSFVAIQPRRRRLFRRADLPVLPEQSPFTDSKLGGLFVPDKREVLSASDIAHLIPFRA